MSTTAVAYTELVANDDIADPAGTAITSGAGNGGKISDAFPELTILRVDNASGGNATVTVLAGDNPPALAAGLGNLTSGTISTGTQAFVGPFESGRFLQNDGSMIVECSANVTLAAFLVPRNT